MNVNKIRIGSIPAMLWGAPGERIILAAHGKCSSKIDDCIWILAEEATAKGYQVLSFDLPQHGERVCEPEPLMPEACVREMRMMYHYAAERAKAVSLFGCSLGAYLELLTFAEAEVAQAWFLSPVTDMAHIIQGLMARCGVTEDELRKKGEIHNGIEPLYYPYYAYVKAHPIRSWAHPTCILRGENDEMCAYADVKGFAERFGCELTIQKGAAHWFHTDVELTAFRGWIRARLGRSDGLEERT